MRTLVIDPAQPQPDAVAEAARWMAADGLTIFPTDTLYGLGANPWSAAAVTALFDAKGRDERQAVPLIAASTDVVRQAAGAWSDRMERVLGCFGPGPLSILIPAPADMPAVLHAGRGTMAVRVPDHALARALAAAAGGLITSTSANRSGHPPANSVAGLDEIAHDPRVLVVDGGQTPGGAPSTIVDLTGDEPVLIRVGAIPAERVMAAWKDCG